MVFLVDFAAWRPPPSHALPLTRSPWRSDAKPACSEACAEYPALADEKLLDHLRQTQLASGSLSAFVAPQQAEWSDEAHSAALPDVSYRASLDEMKESLGGALRLLMEQSGLQPNDIDVLVTNSTIFAPCPSLSSMLVNEFKLRPDVTTLSVSGMGCSFGVVGVGAVRDLMLGRLRENGRRRRSLRGLFSSSKDKKSSGVVNAVFVTGECTTLGMYLGRDPAMLTVSALMRQGAAAVWLSTSSRPKRGARAKYRLCHFSRTHRGADDAAYGSMGTRGDGADRERTGIYFTRDVPRAASSAIDAVLREVAPKLLSPRQLVREALRIRREKRERKRDERPKKRPSFSFANCCEHFALHPGIHSMLVAFTRGMRLPISKALPSFAALRDYANLSAASTWYVLAYLESVGDGDESRGIRKGERVLQLGVGSGVKAAICVWRALRDVEGFDHAAWRHLKGKRVDEGELPLPIPDVFAEEREKDEDEALDAATAVVASVTEGDGRAKKEATRKPRRPPPEVRRVAMERCEEQGREYDVAQRERKERRRRDEEDKAASAAKAAA